jgi:hypothetical protein
MLALSKVQKDLNPFIEEIYADMDKEVDILWKKHLEKTKKMKINTPEYELALDEYDAERNKVTEEHFKIVDNVRTQLETKWGIKRKGEEIVLANDQEESTT